MMKHLYIENQNPKNIYTEVDGKAKKWRKAWITTSTSDYTKVWDISGNEYLKVSENYIGQKFLERYYTQSVYTSVYWVHEVDGQEVETYISSSEFNSWECETLEPYYYTDGDRQYVGYYQIKKDSSFGQHNMKITYKSPESGSTLSVEYQIYYMEEVDLILNQTEYDWYPFRGLWAESEQECLPFGDLKYRCYDNENNEIIVFYTNNRLNFITTRYTFPTVSNARYKFGENQLVHGFYVSSCNKCYDFDIIVNIRKYTDERNPNKNGNNTYYHKNIIPYSFVIDYKENILSYAKLVDRHLFYFPSFSRNDIDISVSNSINVTESDFDTSPSISTDDYENGYDTFATTHYNTLCKNGSNESFLNFTDKEEFISYLQTCKFNGKSILKTAKVKGVNISGMLFSGNAKAITTSYLEAPNNTKIPEVVTFGYVYWGDGTFDIYATGDEIIKNNIFDNAQTKIISLNKYGSINSEKANFTVINVDDAKLKNGKIMSTNGELIDNFETNSILENRYTHKYEKEGIYKIEITAPAGQDIGETSPSASETRRVNFWRFNLNYQSSTVVNQSYSFLNDSEYNLIKNDGDIGTHDKKENFILNDLFTCSDDYIYVGKIVTELEVGTSLGYRRCYGYKGENRNDGYENFTKVFGFNICGLPFLNKIKFNSLMFDSYSNLTSSALGYKFPNSLNYMPRLTQIIVDSDYNQNILHNIPNIYNFNYNNGGLTQYYGSIKSIFNEVSNGSLSNIIYAYSNNQNASLIVYNNDTIKLIVNNGYTNLQSIENRQGSLPENPHNLDLWIDN